MALFYASDTGGGVTGTLPLGTGNVDADAPWMDLIAITNDSAISRALIAYGTTTDLFQITYIPSISNPCVDRIDALVNTLPPVTSPPDIILLAVDNAFVLLDGSPVNAVKTIAPNQSANPTDCVLVVYDSSLNAGHGYCGMNESSGQFDLSMTRAALLYLGLSTAYRMCQTPSALLSEVASGGPCPTPVISPEGAAAIADENILRDQPYINTAHHDPTNSCLNVGCTPPCCIVATIATGSEYSREVNSLRQVRDSFLRRSDVGFSFFDSLLHDYYGFSPQVCRAMTGSPEIQNQIAMGFVQPLTSCLGLIRAWALDGCDAAAIGERFEMAAAGSSITESGARRALAVLRGEYRPTLDARWNEVADAVERRARASVYIDWGLIQTTEMYLEACLLRSGGASPGELGAGLVAAFDAWAPRMPLTDVWIGLPRYTLAPELEFLQSALLRTPESRLRFGLRLADHISPDREMADLMAKAGFLPEGSKQWQANKPKPRNAAQAEGVKISQVAFHDDGTNLVAEVRLANPLDRTIHAVATPRNFQYDSSTRTISVLLSDRRGDDLPGSIFVMPRFVAVDPGGETTLTLGLPRFLTCMVPGLRPPSPKLERLAIHEADSLQIEMDWSDTPFYSDPRSQKTTRLQVVEWAKSAAKAQGSRREAPLVT